MSSAGHIMDAINRLMYNRRQLEARRERYNELRNHYEKSIRTEGFHFKNDNIPKEKLDAIKANIRHNIRRRKLIGTILSVTLTFLIASALIYLALKHI